MSDTPQEELAEKRAEMKALVRATPEQIAAAFTEWERRWREDPDAFMADSEKLADSAESYGEACTPYFIQILKEIQS